MDTLSYYYTALIEQGLTSVLETGCVFVPCHLITIQVGAFPYKTNT